MNTMTIRDLIEAIDKCQVTLDTPILILPPVDVADNHVVLLKANRKMIDCVAHLVLSTGER